MTHKSLQILHTFIFAILVCASVFSQKLIITDGPYIDYVDEGYEVTLIIDNELEQVTKKDIIDEDFKVLPFPITIKKKEEQESIYHFHDVAKIAAISDIHGQYDVMIKLFQSNDIINDKLEWIFGEGHLVITGDIFDRGYQVTEILWFIYELEKQAEEDGGQVHFLLGNHEVMILGGDVRYIHRKYRYTTGISGERYDALFKKESVLGEWLRSKPVTISINDIVFLHAGFSKQIVEEGYTIDSVNTLFTNNMIGVPSEKVINDSLLNTLYLENGPIWYRGYIDKNQFNEQDAVDILKSLDKKHIVVGHTSMQSIVSLFDNRIFMIDSSIKFGKSGELLFWEEGSFYRGSIFGEKLEIIPFKLKSE